MTDEAQRQHRRGVLCVLAASVLWSCTGVIVKSPWMTALPLESRGVQLACYRALFAALAMLPLVSWGRVRWRWGLVPLAISFALMNGCYITAMTRTTAAAAIFLQYTSIGWAALGGVFLLGERFDRGQIIALIGAALGIGVIAAESWHGAYFVGNALAIASGAAYAGVVISLRHLRDEDGPWLVMLAHLASWLVLLPWVPASTLPFKAVQWGSVVLMGAGLMALPYWLFSRSLRTVTVQEAALLPLIEPLLNPCLVWLAWREPVSGSTWLGGGLILGGLLLKALFARGRRPAAESREADREVPGVT
ncbi:MAG: DMT family transporter [Planctomycetaceae bacterium]|nr:DMT family transporter [Planctomycetaceae bacterium]